MTKKLTIKDLMKDNKKLKDEIGELLKQLEYFRDEYWKLKNKIIE